MSGELRVGLIGFGLGGAVFHAPLIAATPGMKLAAIVTSDPGRRGHAQATYPDARVVADAGELWQGAEELELVVIATPNSSHVPLALAAVEAGVPVVIDKPMAPSAAEGRRLVAAAAAADVMISVFQNRRWDGDFLTVRRLVAEGALGGVIRFESRYERWRPERREAAWRERGDPAEAGGLLFDLGSHLIDQAIVLFGPPVRVYAELDRRRPGAEVDDDSFVALEHRSGVRSHLWASATARLPAPRMRVLGLGGAFEKHGLDVQEDALAAGEVPGVPGWGREPPDRWGTLATAGGAERVPTEPGSYHDYYAGIAESLRSGVPPPVDARDSVAALEVIEAAMRSARDGTVEELEWPAAE